VGNNKVFIKCNEKKDAENLTSLITTEITTVKAEMMKKRNPRLILKNIDKSVKTEDIVESILNQNDDIRAIDETDKNKHIIKIVTEFKNKTNI